MKPSLLFSALLATAIHTSPLAAAADAKPLETQLAQARTARDQDAQREILLRLLEQKPTEGTLLRSVAELQLAAREYDRCGDTLARLAAALGKPDAGLLEMRGDLGKATANDDDERAAAAKHWSAALKLEPRRASALLRLATYHSALGEYAEEALMRLRLVRLRDAPTDHAALARHAVRVRDWDSLITRTSHLREKFANTSEGKYWNPMYDRLMKQAAPLAALDARLDANPNAIGALLERAWLFDSVGLDELASDDAERALKLEPDSLALRYQHAVILAHGGKAYQAERDYGIRAEHYRHKRRMPDKDFFPALLKLEKRIAEKPDAKAHSERATLLLENGQQDLATIDAKAAVAIDPILADAHYVLARAYRKADHTRAAKASFRQVLDIDPKNTAALSQLGYLQMDLGDFADAAATFSRLLAIEKSAIIATARRKCLASLQD